MTACNTTSAVKFVVLLLKIFHILSAAVSIDCAVLSLLIMWLFWSLTSTDFIILIFFFKIKQSKNIDCEQMLLVGTVDLWSKYLMYFSGTPQVIPMQ